MKYPTPAVLGSVYLLIERAGRICFLSLRLTQIPIYPVNPGCYSIFPVLLPPVLAHGWVRYIPDSFSAVVLLELRQLQVTVMDMPCTDGEKTMTDILECLEIAFSSLNLFNFGSVRIPWTGTKDTWEPVEAVCAARNIKFVMRHPL